MLIIRRRLQTRQRHRHGGNLFANVIKSIVNKISAQKVVDAVVNGGARVAGEAAAKGAKSAAELALKRVSTQNNKPKNKKQRIHSVNALFKGSGIIYE